MYSSTRRKALFTRGRRNAGQPHWFLVMLSIGALVAVTLLDVNPNHGTLSVTTLEQLIASN
jgi:hypothetical protein